MQNVAMRVDGDKLVIEVDLSKEIGPSSSGKTILIASTEGNANAPGHEGMKLGSTSTGRRSSRSRWGSGNDTEELNHDEEGNRPHAVDHHGLARSRRMRYRAERPATATTGVHEHRDDDVLPVTPLRAAGRSARTGRASRRDEARRDQRCGAPPS
jgi:hypothetical protein